MSAIAGEVERMDPHRFGAPTAMRSFAAATLTAGALATGLAEEAAAQAYPLPTPPGTTPPVTEPVAQPLALMSPFPIVRIAGRLTRQGASIRLLSVRASTRALILVRCFRKGCRRRSLRRGRGRRPVRFRRFELNLRAGTLIEVRVRQAGAIGKFTRFRIRRGRGPARRDLCLYPDVSRGAACPER